MCSHMPDTTRPMAKPATPVVTAPRNAARRKNPRTMPSIGRSQNEVTSAWMDGCHLKGRLLCPLRSEQVGIGAAWIGNPSKPPRFRLSRIAGERKSTPLNYSHSHISYVPFCFSKKKEKMRNDTRSGQV